MLEDLLDVEHLHSTDQLEMVLVELLEMLASRLLFPC